RNGGTVHHRCSDRSISSYGPLSSLFGALVLCSLLILFSPSRSMADFTGPVISILAGDTIEVLHNTHPERIRLSGIDCPEKGQAYGTRARQTGASTRSASGHACSSESYSE